MIVDLFLPVCHLLFWYECKMCKAAYNKNLQTAVVDV